MTSMSLPSECAFITSWIEIGRSVTAIPLSSMILSFKSRMVFLMVPGSRQPLSWGVASSSFPYLFYIKKKTFNTVISWIKSSSIQRTSSNPFLLASDTAGTNGPRLPPSEYCAWPSGQFLLKELSEHLTDSPLLLKVVGLRTTQILELFAVLTPITGSVEMWRNLA